MLTISSSLLAVFFLTKVTVLAAPIPLNGAPYDDALFSRTSKAPSNKTPPVQSGTFAST